MGVGILPKTDGNVRGIGVLHKMGMVLSNAHQEKENPKCNECNRVHPHDECLVRTAEGAVKVIIDRLLRQSRTPMLIQCKGDGSNGW